MMNDCIGWVFCELAFALFKQNELEINSAKKDNNVEELLKQQKELNMYQH